MSMIFFHFIHAFLTIGGYTTMQLKEGIKDVYITKTLISVFKNTSSLPHHCSSSENRFPTTSFDNIITHNNISIDQQKKA